MTQEQPIAGVLLAGGRASRMGGGDKCLVALGGKPLLAHAIARLSPQVDILVLNANGDASRFAAFGLPVVADSVAGRTARGRARRHGLGAGAYAGRARHRHRRHRHAVLSPGPGDAVGGGDEGQGAGRGALGEGEHYAFGLWPIALAPDLRRALAEGRRKAGDFVHEHGALAVDFAPQEIGGTRVDPFFNINIPEDLARAAALLVRA